MKPIPLNHQADFVSDPEFKAAFLQSWGSGWKLGYHTKPDVVITCPYPIGDWRRTWFNDGVCAGADAREQIEPWPEKKNADTVAA